MEQIHAEVRLAEVRTLEYGGRAPEARVKNDFLRLECRHCAGTKFELFEECGESSIGFLGLESTDKAVKQCDW